MHTLCPVHPRIPNINTESIDVKFSDAKGELCIYWKVFRHKWTHNSNPRCSRSTNRIRKEVLSKIIIQVSIPGKYGEKREN